MDSPRLSNNTLWLRAIGIFTLGVAATVTVQYQARGRSGNLARNRAIVDKLVADLVSAHDEKKVNLSADVHSMDDAVRLGLLFEGNKDALFNPIVLARHVHRDDVYLQIYALNERGYAMPGYKFQFVVGYVRLRAGEIYDYGVLGPDVVFFPLIGDPYAR